MLLILVVKMRLTEKGIKYVLNYEKEQKRKPIDVSKNKNFVGFDIISIDPKKNDHRLIEVKATETEKGIPDAYANEFTRNLKFVATHLYVVKFKGNKSTLYIIPKKEIDKYEHKIFPHVRFNHKLKTEIEKFKVKI